MKNRPTLTDIARSAGVDKSTVSRALRGDPRVCSSTQDRIKALATELGYVPDPILSAIGRRGGKRSHTGYLTVALLLDRGSRGPRGAVGAIDLESLSRTARQFGYTVEVFYVDDYPQHGELEKLLTARYIRGVIVGPSYHPQLFQALDLQTFTCVGFQVDVDVVPVHSVMGSPFHDVMEAWRQVRRAGYRRIGPVLFRHPYDVPDDHERSAAITFAQRAGNDGDSPIPAYTYEHAWESLADLPAWVAEHRPDVILSFNNTVWAALQAHDISVPDTVAYATLHNTPAEPSVAGLQIDREAMDETLFRLLDYSIKTNQWGYPQRPVIHSIRNRWVGGGSLPPRVPVSSDGSY